MDKIRSKNQNKEFNIGETKIFRRTKVSSGQILLEYILLLLIGIMIGSIIVKKLTAYGDEPDNRGALINRWMKIWDSIGNDFPDK